MRISSFLFALLGFGLLLGWLLGLLLLGGFLQKLLLFFGELKGRRLVHQVGVISAEEVFKLLEAQLGEIHLILLERLVTILNGVGK